MSRARIKELISVLTAMSLGLGLFVGLVALSVPAEAEELPLRFNAIAVNMSNVGPRGQQRLDVTVNRWSTDEERARLMETLKAQVRTGSREIANTLFGKDSVGTIRETGSLAYDLRYSREIPNEEGRQIILVTDRPIDFAETWRASRTLDYNVSIIILNVDAEGRGDGQIMLGAQFSWDEEKNQITIEHFASEPIRLTSVRLR